MNAGPAYMVNDLYKKYFKPKASDKHYIRASYWASGFIVLLGVVMGFFAESINALTLWITGALFGGYIVANFLKWCGGDSTVGGLLLGHAFGFIGSDFAVFVDVKIRMPLSKVPFCTLWPAFRLFISFGLSLRSLWWVLCWEHCSHRLRICTP